MEKVLDLKMPGLMDLGRDELKEVDGGLEPLTTFALIVGLEVGYLALCDYVHEVGEKIGEALAK